jgi:hypothetical protein
MDDTGFGDCRGLGDALVLLLVELHDLRQRRLLLVRLLDNEHINTCLVQELDFLFDANPSHNHEKLLSRAICKRCAYIAGGPCRVHS